MPTLPDIKRILILRCGALGDLVYATSIIDALVMEYGENVAIDFITTPGSGKLFDNDPRIHRVFGLKHKKVPIFLSSEKKKIIRHSKKNPYDLLILLDFDKHFKSLIRHIDAKHRTGMGFLDTSVSERSNRGEYVKKFYRDVIDPAILAKAKPKLFGSEIAFPLPENYIVLAPSNSHNQKKGINYRAWPFEHWRELIRDLPNTSFVMVGARGEEAFFDHLKPYPPNVTDLVGMLSIPQLISVIRKGRALICTDSASGHIGAAVDTPTFVLMGPNNPLTDSPYQSDTNAVYPISLHLPCSPCYKTNTMKTCKDNICMSLITPENVIESLKSANIV